MKNIYLLLKLTILFIFMGCGEVITEKEITQNNTLNTNTTKTPFNKEFGTEEDELYGETVIDAKGNIYITGSTQGNLKGLLTGRENLFIMKLSAKGDELWVKQYAVNSTDSMLSGNSMIIDNDDNLYIHGDFEDGVFLAKYTNEGKELWVRKDSLTNTWSSYTARKLAIDNNGYLYTTGEKYNREITRDDNNSIVVKMEAGMYLTKYSSDGEKIWEEEFNAIEINGNSHELNTITFDNENNIYIGGAYTSKPFEYSNGDKDIFINKFTASGELLWRKIIATEDSIYKNINASEAILKMKIIDGYMYTIGYTNGNMDGNHPINYDELYDNFMIFAKYKLDGTQVWLKQFDFSQKLGIGFNLCLNPTGNISIFSNQTEGKVVRTDSRKVLELEFDKNGNLLNQKIISKNFALGGLYEKNVFYTPNNELIFSGKYNNGIGWKTDENGVFLIENNTLVGDFNMDIFIKKL